MNEYSECIINHIANKGFYCAYCPTTMLYRRCRHRHLALDRFFFSDSTCTQNDIPKAKQLQELFTHF